MKAEARTDLIFELGTGKGKIIVGTVLKVEGQRGARFQFVSAKINETTGEVEWVNVYGGAPDRYKARAFSPALVTKAPKAEQTWFSRKNDEELA